MHETTATIARITPHSICIYSEPPAKFYSADRSSPRNKKPIINHFRGEMSSHTRKKVRKSVENWISAITTGTGKARKARRVLDHYVTFITLTLSARQQHTDQEIKREVLNHFLIKLQRNHDVGNYLWVAEKQKNGNIHFHVIIDKFVRWQSVRSIWNNCQERLQYITKFKEKYNHGNPNSTDIHALRKVKNVTAYICKYLTKEQEGEKVSGRLWAGSRAIKSTQYFRDVIDSEMADALKAIRQSGKVKVKQCEYCTFIWGDILGLLYKLNLPIYKRLEAHYETIFNFLYYNKGKEEVSLPCAAYRPGFSIERESQLLRPTPVSCQPPRLYLASTAQLRFDFL